MVCLHQVHNQVLVEVVNHLLQEVKVHQVHHQVEDQAARVLHHLLLAKGKEEDLQVADNNI